MSEPAAAGALPLARSASGAQGIENWVQCDRCGKWRRVREELVEALDDDSNWFCEDNPDEHHNSCNIPQELSNDEIDRGRAQEALQHERLKRQRRPAVWQLVKENIYTHRKPKKLYEDDIMVCQCKPGSAKGISCNHEDCLNGMLNIECITGFCPSGKECRNQRFQRKQYAKFEVRRAGLKGFGLFALEHIPKGAFIVEYVGEVLDEEEYLRRKEYYHSVGQRHYYFMNIGNGEVVDACRKGNKARFINHSCEPNCETQKWMVKGELKIGFFATKDIPANMELQFDYNFERYGDKPTKCHCQAATCRGFIGGSSDRYAGAAVDDAAMQGLDLPPIMIAAGELKDGKFGVDLDVMMDQVVGIGIGAETTNALDQRLQALAAEQGSVWAPQSASVSPAGSPRGVAPIFGGALGSQNPHGVPQAQFPKKPLVWPAAPAPGCAPPLPMPGWRAPGEPAAAANPVHPVPTPAPAVAGSNAAVDSVAAEAASPPTGTDGSQPRKKAAADLASGARAAEDSESGETRISSDDEEEPAAASSSEEEPAEDDDWLDSSDRYKELNEAPPAVPPPAAKRKRTTRQLKARKRTATGAFSPPPAQSATLHAGQGEEVNAKGSTAAVSQRATDQHAQPPHADTDRKYAADRARQSAKAEQIRRAGLPGRDESASAVEPPVSTSSVKPDSSASVATGVHLPGSGSAAPHTHSCSDRGDHRGLGSQSAVPQDAVGYQVGDAVQKKRSRVVVKTISPSKPVRPPGQPSDSTPAVAPPPEAPAPANSFKRSLWPKPGQTRGPPMGGSAAGTRRRSEVERRLELLVGAHKMVKVDYVKDFLRLFNMCDISPPSHEEEPRSVGSPDDVPVVRRSRRHYNMETEMQLTHRQKARMADLNLLLEKVLEASGHTLKKELVRCGLLSRLQFCAINNYGAGYTPALRKICKAVQTLPVTDTDVWARRSAHGSFADVMRALSSHSDREIRKRAHAFLETHPLPPGMEPPPRPERPERLQGHRDPGPTGSQDSRRSAGGTRSEGGGSAGRGAPLRAGGAHVMTGGAGSQRGVNGVGGSAPPPQLRPPRPPVGRHNGPSAPHAAGCSPAHAGGQHYSARGQWGDSWRSEPSPKYASAPGPRHSPTAPLPTHPPPPSAGYAGHHIRPPAHHNSAANPRMALPAARTPAPPQLPAHPQPPPPPSPRPPPPPFYPVDVQHGEVLAKLRLQECAKADRCRSSMLGVPVSVPQAVQMGMYDAAKFLMRRPSTSQRRRT